MGAMTVCQLNVAQQLLITEEHLLHLEDSLCGLFWLISIKSHIPPVPLGAKAAFRMLPLQNSIGN